MEEEKEEIPRWKVYIFMLLMLLSGSLNTIANKLQQNTTPLGISYSHHQKFITFCMFHGEVVCLILYYLIIYRREMSKKNRKLEENQITKDEQKTKKKNNPQPKFYYFFFPAFFDVLASTSTSISLTYLAPSIYQMFRGAIIIFTCLGSIIFLKTKYHRHHFLGIFIVICGLIIVGLNAVLFDDNKNTDDHPSTGIILVLTGQIFAASMFITEEKLLKKFNCHPLKVVGSEGCWGVLTYYLLLIIFYNLRCENWAKNLKDGICIENLDGELRFEDAPFAIIQILNDYKLDCILLLYISSIAVFNFSGLLVTKHVSSTARTVVDTLRTIIVWVFFLTMPLSIKESFSWLQLLGFVILIIGSVIFNEIVELHCLGFDKNTKRAKKEREEKNKIQEENNIEETNDI